MDGCTEPSDALLQRLLAPSEEVRAGAVSVVLSLDVTALPREWTFKLARAAFFMFMNEPELRLDEDLSTKRLFGSRVDCYTVILHVYHYLEMDLTSSRAFWAVLHWGLRARESNRQLRKTAVSLFQKALTAVRNTFPAPVPEAVSAWGVFCALLDTLDDAPMHLVLEQWPRLVRLFGAPPAAARDMQEPAEIPVPAFSSPAIPFEWLCVLLDRAFSHEVAPVRRVLLHQFLSTDASCAPVTGDGSAVPLLVFRHGGGPLSLHVPAWYVCGLSADACTASVDPRLSDDGYAATLSVSMPSLLQRCCDPAMYKVAAFSAALRSFLAAFIAALGSSLPPTGCSAGTAEPTATFIRRVIVRSRDLVHCKGGMRAVLGALSSNSVEAASPGSGAALGPCALANLRVLLLAMASCSTRSFMARRYAEALMLIVHWASPLAAPLPDIAHTLASFPAACILPQALLVEGTERTSGAHPAAGYPAVSAWLSALGGCNCAQRAAIFSASLSDYFAATESMSSDINASPEAPGSASEIGSLGLLAAEDQPDRPRTPWSAASLARLFVLLPWAGTYHSDSTPQIRSDRESSAESAASVALVPLLDTLCAMSMHTYMKEHTQSRALLLLHALLSQVYPLGCDPDEAAEDSGVEDLHLSAACRWGAAPALSSMLHPVTAEFRAAARAVRVRGVLPYARAFGSLAAPEGGTWSGLDLAGAYDGSEDVRMPCGEATGTLPQYNRAILPESYSIACAAIKRLAAHPGVSSEVASRIESLCSPGLTLCQRPSGAAAHEASVAVWTAEAGLRFLVPQQAFPSMAASAVAASALRSSSPLRTSLLAAESPLPAVDPPGWSASIVPVAIPHPHWSVPAALGLLRLCIRSCKDLESYAICAKRLISLALDALKESADSCGVRTVQSVHALQTLVALCPTLRPPQQLGVLTPEGDGALSVGRASVSYVIAAALRLRFDQPVSGTGVQLALPLALGYPDDPRVCSAVSGALYADAVPVSWAQLRGLFESCRWALLSAAVRTLDNQSSAFPLFQPALLIESAVDALETAMPDYLHAVISVLGACLRLAAEAANLPPPTAAGEPPPKTSHSLADLLAALRRAASGSAVPRKVLLAYVAAVSHPSLFQRPALHLSTSPALLVHLMQLITELSDTDNAENAAPAIVAQALTARLIAVYGDLLENADCPHGAASADILAAHVPLMCLLLLYREPVLPHEDPTLADSLSQLQMKLWLDDQRLHSTVRLPQSPSRGLPGETEPPRAPAFKVLQEANTAVDSLSRRGGGAVARVQMLMFVNELCSRAAVARARALLQSTSQPPLQSFALRLQRLLLLRLLAVFSRAEWHAPGGSSVGMPGSALHGTKLRIMQAVAILGSRWGEVDRGAGFSSRLSGAVAAPAWFWAASCYPRWLYSVTHDFYFTADALSDCSGHGCISANEFLGPIAEFSRPGAAAPLAPAKARKSRQGGEVVAEAFPAVPSALRGADEPASPSEASAYADDVATAAVVMALLSRYALGAVQLPSTRQYMEGCMMALARRFPEACLQIYIEPWLGDLSVRAQPTLSCVTTATDLCIHLAGAAVTAPDAPVASLLRLLARATLDALLPHLVSPVGICRAFAQVALHDAAFKLYPHLFNLLPAVGAPPPRSLRLLEQIHAVAVVAPDATGAAALAPYVRMVSAHPDSVDMVERQRKNLARLDPSRTMTLRALLCSPATEHGELVPQDVLHDIKESLTVQAVRLHERERIGAPESSWLDDTLRWAIGAGVLPRRAALDERLRVGFCHSVEESACLDIRRSANAGGAEQRQLGSSVQHTHTDTQIQPLHDELRNGSENFQRKVLSAAAASELQTHAAGSSEKKLQLEVGTSTGSLPLPVTAGATGTGSASGCQWPGPAAPPALATPLPVAQIVLPVPVPVAAIGVPFGAGVPGPGPGFGPPGPLNAAVLTERSEAGRPCQPLVVVASLVDRIPNLGGLARTCEIFAAESLVLPSLKVASDPGFKDVSVSAASLMTLHECPPANLLQFLLARKAQGYTIVGLEQTARSRRLGVTVLPDRMVLLLGAEREGIPVELLQHLDVCLEIPQLGLIRSLNVHVSGALVAWEYTRQRLEAAAAGLSQHHRAPVK